MMSKLFIQAGAIFAFLAVLLGAFGAHGLRNRLSEDALSVWNTAVLYQMFHALGLLVIGLIAHNITQSLWLKLSGYSLMIGIILFSGSLYLLVLLEMRKLGIVTPFGGFAFLLGWIFLFLAMYK